MPEVMEQIFNAEWDAQTLAEAAAINDNPARLAAASVAAGQLITEAEAKAEALKGIQTKIYNHATSEQDRAERAKGSKSK